MNKRSRRNHSAGFKAKVALEAIKGGPIIVGLSERFRVHLNQIMEWKNQLLDRASENFDKSYRHSKGPDIKELHARTGRLAMGSFLLDALGYIDATSTKKLINLIRDIHHKLSDIPTGRASIASLFLLEIGI